MQLLQSFQSIQSLLQDLQNVSQSYMFTFNNASVIEMNYVVCGGLPNMTGFRNLRPTPVPSTTEKVAMSSSPSSKTKTYPATTKSTTTVSTTGTTKTPSPLLFEKLTFSQNASTTSSTTNKKQGNNSFWIVYNYLNV